MLGETISKKPLKFLEFTLNDHSFSNERNFKRVVQPKSDDKTKLNKVIPR